MRNGPGPGDLRVHNSLPRPETHSVGKLWNGTGARARGYAIVAILTLAEGGPRRRCGL
ncbi:MAG: hypothetical protein MJE68_20230 [Proteobacteria bacterium]|nr:hypothetical protein [Pseudomonadota bacterium]